MAVAYTVTGRPSDVAGSSRARGRTITMAGRNTQWRLLKKFTISY